ncbi:hypothetical protein EYZ11_007468 [Aspergillus tanneri]|nr:hypothetical protein EYZ11_007468 [Aspergillus tanneri]
MGFDAVMISPIVKNIEGHVRYGEAYHGYWAQDMYSLNPHFGTKQDLLDLSKAIHDRGMYLMMDTVINNMAYITNGGSPASDIDYSTLYPFNDPKYFHPYCKITDYNDYLLAQKCWTGDDIVVLPDLNTEDEQVQRMLVKWVKEVISNYSIDGLRLDAAKHVTPDFLPLFQEAADTFITGEVFDKSVRRICGYQDELTSLPNYPIYYSLLDAFTRGNTSSLPDQVEIMKNNCPDVTSLTSFSENHDVARFVSLKSDMTLAKNVLTFTILFDGIPMIYQGQEQHYSGSSDPENREALWLSKYDTKAPLYKAITILNQLRKHASRVDPKYLDTQTYAVYKGLSEMAFRKGREGRQIVMVLSTQGSNSSEYTIRMMNGYQPSYVVIDVFTCKTYTINDMGELRLDMDKGEPRVLYPTDLMHGSGLCGYDYANVSYLDFQRKPLNSSNDTSTSSGAGVPPGLDIWQTIWSVLVSVIVCLAMFVL